MEILFTTEMDKTKLEINYDYAWRRMYLFYSGDLLYWYICNSNEEYYKNTNNLLNHVPASCWVDANGTFQQK